MIGIVSVYSADLRGIERNSMTSEIMECGCAFENLLKTLEHVREYKLRWIITNNCSWSLYLFAKK